MKTEMFYDKELCAFLRPLVWGGEGMRKFDLVRPAMAPGGMIKGINEGVVQAHPEENEDCFPCAAPWNMTPPLRRNLWMHDGHVFIKIVDYDTEGESLIVEMRGNDGNIFSEHTEQDLGELCQSLDGGETTILAEEDLPWYDYENEELVDPEDNDEIVVDSYIVDDKGAFGPKGAKLNNTIIVSKQ